MKVYMGMLLWAFPAHIFFGLCNFFIGVSNDLGVDKWAAIGMLWIVSGLVGLIAASYFYYHYGRFFFSEMQEGNEMQPITSFVKTVTVVGGLAVGLSQYLMMQSFALSPALTGPLCAVISSDTLVVSTFCHFYYNERLSGKQASAIICIVLGLIIVALSSSSPSQGTEAGGGATLAFMLAVCGMLFFAGAVLSIRTSCCGGVSPWSGFTTRMLANLVIGMMAFGYSVHSVGWPEIPLLNWSPPVAAGLTQAAGVLCVNNALHYPNTGIANAIFASNSIMVLVLQLVIFHLLPGIWSLIGMGIVLLGVATISLLQDGGVTESDAALVPQSPRACLKSPYEWPDGKRSPSLSKPLLLGSPFTRVDTPEKP